MELRGADTTHGRVKRARRPRRVVCDLSDDLPGETQAFVGFVVMALWDRQAAIAGATASGGGAVAPGSQSRTGIPASRMRSLASRTLYWP
jgi:hypothetical protein